jgi:hypothetical protein
MNTAKINTAVESKNEVEFNQSIQEFCESLTAEVSEYALVAIINELKSKREGKRGRIESPFTEEKAISSTGKRGRPALSVEEKLERLQLKLEKEKEALLNKSVESQVG